MSHESRDWQRSRDDCAQKGSALFIIRNREQMVNQGPVLGWGAAGDPQPAPSISLGLIILFFEGEIGSEQYPCPHDPSSHPCQEHP